MEIGLHLSSETPPDKPLGEQIDELLAHTRAADEAGFDWVGMGQHYLLEHPKPQTIPMLARAAAETDRMGLYTGVLLLPLHQPVEIAEQFVTLSHFAPRLALGVGVGYIDREFRNFGIDKRTRAPRFRESLEIITRLWTEEDVTYDGEYHSVDGATLTARPAETPLVWCGGQALSAVQRAAEIGDAWFPGPQLSRTDLADVKTTYDQYRTQTGKSTAIPLFREAYVAPTTDEAFAIAGDPLRGKYASYLERNLNNPESGFSSDPTASSDGFRSYAADRFLIGSPEKILSDIEAFDETLDLSHLMLRLRRPGQSSQDTIDCIHLIGDEVIPNL